MNLVELRPVGQYQVALVRLTCRRRCRWALWVRMSPEHLQVASCEDVEVNCIGFLGQCRKDHLNEDIELFVVSGSLSDLLDKASTEL